MSASVIAEFAPEVLRHLPAKQSRIALGMGRKASGGSVRRTLEALAAAGVVERVDGA